MRRVDECALYITDNPTASNQEIADALDITEGYAKKLVHDLRKMGAVEIDKESKERMFIVNSEKLNNKVQDVNVNRKQRVEQLLDIVFESLENETQFDSIISAGHLIIKLLDRL